MQAVFQQWQSFSNEHLRTRDIAFGNLRSAVGLPGFAFETNDIPALQDKLNAWESLVRIGTERLLPKFHQQPAEYGETPGRFRMLVLVTVLQRNLGVTYNQRFSQVEYDAADPRNLFLHGVLSGFGGTCVTMPLLYIAIGRRLGYPLFLVEAKEHFFVRWEGQGERFNIEATSQGFVPRDTDAYYREWPGAITADEVEKGIYLRNLTPREEIGCSLHSRGICFFEHLMIDEALEAFVHAGRMAPRNPTILGSLLVAEAARVILRNMASLPQSMPLEESLAKAAPPVSRPEYSWAVRIAKNEILRIDRNRRDAAQESQRRGIAYVLEPIKLKTPGTTMTVSKPSRQSAPDGNERFKRVGP
jgi:hypothetical protein